MPTRTIQFPLTLPDDEVVRQQRARHIEQQLTAWRGIEQARVIHPNGVTGIAQAPVLELTYDPATMSLTELRRCIDESGYGLNASVAELVLPIEGLVSPRKEAIIQRVLNRLPGVTAVVSFASQSIRLEFDRSRCALPEVVRQLDHLGIRVRSPAEVARRPAAPPSMLRRAWLNAREYPRLSTAIVGGVALVLGTIVHFTDGPQALRLILLAIAYALCGWHTAWESLRTLGRLRVDIDVLMFAAALGAAALGHFEEGALLLLLFALGGAGEQLAMGKARQAIRALTDLTPQTATRIEDGRDRIVRVEELEVGDRIRIAADEQIPADAEVIEGISAVDQSPITGESVPIDKREGDALFSGTMNGPGNLVAVVAKPAQDNTLSKVIRLVEEAQTTKSPTQQLAERFERWYVPFVLAATMLLMLAPPLIGITPRQQGGALWAGWFYQALAFLTAASPCALAIGTPAAVLSGIGRAARVGVLIKGGAHLEAMSRLGAVAFDKTGTLTVGRPRVVAVEAVDKEHDEQTLLALAAAVEHGSRHPLGQAIADEAEARQIEPAKAEDVRRAAGAGITGFVAGQQVTVGSPVMFEPMLERAAQVKQRVTAIQRDGRTVVCVAVGEVLVGLIALADTPRPTAREAIAALKDVGINHTIMLTGDHPEAARAVARQVGLDRVEAGLLPQQKLDTIRKLDREFGGVAMVGDGVNDAPALAAARVGVAIGGATGVGSDVALETADVALLTDDLRRLPEAIGMARFTRTIVRQNITIALGVIAILAPVAALGGAPISVAVLFHEGSTVVVVLNALRILAYRRASEGVAAASAVGAVSSMADREAEDRPSAVRL